METLEPLSVHVTYVTTMPRVPWLAELRDKPGSDHWLLRYRGESVNAAIVGLAAQMQYFSIAEGSRLTFICSTAVIHSDLGPASMIPSSDYSMGMGNDTGDEDDQKPRMKRPACTACNITSERYPDGTNSGISDRPTRTGHMAKLCHLCGLKEQLAALEQTRRNGTAGGTPKDFDRWLTPGDRLRAYALGIALEGELPAATPEQLAAFALDYERSY